ncbi:hypothetical protein MHYP_G00190950 [Metynnis hypsauchen]
MTAYGERAPTNQRRRLTAGHVVRDVSVRIREEAQGRYHDNVRLAVQTQQRCFLPSTQMTIGIGSSTPWRPLGRSSLENLNTL